MNFKGKRSGYFGWTFLFPKLGLMGSLKCGKGPRIGRRNRSMNSSHFLSFDVLCKQC